MFKWTIFHSRLAMGLDINPREIRLVALKMQNQGVRVCYDEALLSPDPFEEHLLEWVRGLALPQKKVAIALPFSMIMHKRVKWPVVESDIARYFPDCDDVLCFDYIKLSKHEALIFAACKTHLQSTLDLLARAGLSVSAVDVDVYAWLRAISFFMNDRKSEAILDLYHAPARLMIFHQHELLFQIEWSDVDSLEPLKNVLQQAKHVNSLILLESRQSAMATRIQYECQLAVHLLKLPDFIHIDALTSYGLALRGLV